MRNEERGTRNECRGASVALRSIFPRISNPTVLPRSSLLAPRPPLGLTLVELLITILIIGILAAAVLGVAAVAGQSARESRTRIMIARLHTLVSEQYDTYKSRRVKVRNQVINAINSGSGTAVEKNQRKVRARLYALRELMLLEIPQRWSDLLLHTNDVPSPPSSYDPTYLRHTVYLQVPAGRTGQAGRPELTTVYLRHFQRICNSNNKITGSPNTREEILANESAECLYLFVINACGDGEARSLFPESMIGDTDGDGALEFLDGWGRPIGFLRWAPGFNSEIQPNAATIGDYPQIGPPRIVNTNWEEVAARDHDPFDIQRVELAAFRLVPLIYSLGANGEAGIEDHRNMLWVGLNDADAVNSKALSPYIRPTASPAQYAGEISTIPSLSAGRESAVDNIHNHLISMKPRR